MSENMSYKNSNDSYNPANLRRTVLDMAFSGSTVHIGCAFSLIEILAVLYRSHLSYPGNDPSSESRDYLILSKGHGVMAQYACLRERGWLSDEDIKNYFKDGTHLKGLSDSRVLGLEVTSGSLGHGFSVGVGLAKAAKLRRTAQKTFAIIGDGELNEGPIWEGAFFAAHHKLDNLMVIVDQNGFQAMGATDDILELGDLAEKFRSFGFAASHVDGHDELALDRSIDELWALNPGKPKALIAKTVKGSGVDFMAGDNTWHYRRLNSESYAAAIKSLSRAS